MTDDSEERLPPDIQEYLRREGLPRRGDAFRRAIGDLRTSGGIGGWLGIGAVLTAIAGVLLDHTVPRINNYFSTHQFTASVIAELLILVAVLVVLERMVALRDGRQWEAVAGEPVKAVRWWLVSAQIWMERVPRFTYSASFEEVRGSGSGRVEGHRAKRDLSVERRRGALDALAAALDDLRPLALAHESLATRYATAREYLRLAVEGAEFDVTTAEYERYEAALRGAWKDVERAWGWKLESLWMDAFVGLAMIDVEEGIF